MSLNPRLRLVETVRQVEDAPAVPSGQQRVRFQTPGPQQSVEQLDVQIISEDAIEPSLATQPDDDEWIAPGARVARHQKQTSDDDLIDALERSARMEHKY